MKFRKWRTHQSLVFQNTLSLNRNGFTSVPLHHFEETNGVKRVGRILQNHQGDQGRSRIPDLFLLPEWFPEMCVTDEFLKVFGKEALAFE